MASQKKDIEITCEFCKQSFDQTRILRHIGQSESCKIFYGPRFIEMKKKKGREKVQKHRRKNSATSEQLQKRKDKYANKPDIKEKNRQIYQKNKEKIKEENKKRKI